VLLLVAAIPSPLRTASRKTSELLTANLARSALAEHDAFGGALPPGELLMG